MKLCLNTLHCKLKDVIFRHFLHCYGLGLGMGLYKPSFNHKENISVGSLAKGFPNRSAGILKSVKLLQFLYFFLEEN